MPYGDRRGPEGMGPRTGRGFGFINPKTKETEIVENSYKDLMQGAGVQVAQLIANRKVSILLTGDCGPKAAQVLESANISIVTGVSGRVEDAAKNIIRGEIMPDEEIQKKIEKNLEKIDNRLLVFSGKGGVGKSTVSANLALALAQKGMKVGLMDVDIHGPNLAKMLGVEDKKLEVNEDGAKAVQVNENLQLISIAFLLMDPNSPVIWRGPLKMKAIQQFLGDINWGKLDWLIIDSPPGTGDEPLSIAQLIPATGAIVVTTPQEVSLMDSRKAVGFASKLNLKMFGIVENMSGLICPHCGQKIALFKEGGGERAAAELGVPFLGKIPLEPKIVDLGDNGESFLEKYPDSEASREFSRMVEKIMQAAS